MIKAIQKKLKNKKGFTLIELIIVIAILGIIATIAVPKFAGMQDKAKRGADITSAKAIADQVAILMAEDKIDYTSDRTVEVVKATDPGAAPSPITETYIKKVIQYQLTEQLQDIPKIKSNINSKQASSFYVIIDADDKTIKVTDAESSGDEIYPTPDTSTYGKK